MKKLLLTISSLFIVSFCTMAQTYRSYESMFKFDIDAIVVKPIENLAKGERVKLVEYGIVKIGNSNGEYKVPYLVLSDGQILEDKNFSKYFDVYSQQENIPAMWNAYSWKLVLPYVVKNGWQKQLRNEMEADALEYVKYIETNNIKLEDPYLESYLYGLISKILPCRPIDERNYNCNVIVEQNNSVNASCYPNGTIVITTGMLAALHSEDELVAVLAHEIAHYVLDHSIQRVTAEKKRQDRATFWSAMTMGAAMVLDGVVASRNENYIPGGITMATIGLSTILSAKLEVQLGMDYNHDQENDADTIAVKVLELLGYDRNALATALNRINAQNIAENDPQASYFRSYTHPVLMDRIGRAGIPNYQREVKYEQLVSFAVSNVAMILQGNRRFSQCLPFVEQNIENNVATANDYLIKVDCLLSTQEAPNKEDIIALLAKAKELAPNSTNVVRAEIVANTRIGNNEQAIALLTIYIGMLEDARLPYDIYVKEMQWAQNMTIKLKGILGM